MVLSLHGFAAAVASSMRRSLPVMPRAVKSIPALLHGALRVPGNDRTERPSGDVASSVLGPLELGPWCALKRRKRSFVAADGMQPSVTSVHLSVLSAWNTPRTPHSALGPK